MTLRREVKHGGRGKVGQGLSDKVPVGDIPREETIPRVRFEALQVRRVPRVGQTVQIQNFRALFPSRSQNEI